MVERESSGCLKFFLIGCVVCVLLAVCLVAGSIYLVKTKGPEVAAYFVTMATDAMLDGSGLSQEEKQGVKDQIARATDKLKAGEIAIADLERFGKSMDESPFVGLIALAGFEQGAVRSSGLSDEEKENGSRTIQRVQRGLVEVKLDMDDLGKLIDEFSALGENASGAGQQKMSDEDIRAILADLEAQADEAEISDATYAVDYAAETRKAVDILLGEATAGDVQSATP